MNEIVTFRPTRDGIGCGDYVKVLLGKYSGTYGTVVSLGATDRIKLSIPDVSDMKNARHTGWISAKSVIIQNGKPTQNIQTS